MAKFYYALAIVLFGSAALAQDAKLTGTWQGVQVCDDTYDGVAEPFVSEDQIEISQRGDRLRLRRIIRGGELALVYKGTVVSLASSDRFEAMASVCGGSYRAEEMLRLRNVSVDADGSGTFDGESLFATADAPSFPGVQIYGSCKWAYERVSSDDPHVPRC